MEPKNSVISDYCPLCIDLGEYNDSRTDIMATISLSSEELIEWANRNNLTGLQVLTLLIKNAFEGHTCHLNKVPIDKLFELGTIQDGFTGENTCAELASEFIQHLHHYMEGIECAWKKAVTQNPGFQEVDIQSTIYYILTNQFFRFPLSFLKDFSTQHLLNLTTAQKSQLRIKFLLHSTAMSHAAQRSFIDQVDDQYAEKFRDIILKLRSKETVLYQLSTKLDYANDPSVKTEEQLERKYFEFLVATNVTRFENRHPSLSLELKEDIEAHEFKELLKAQIKKLYKAISKNCSEVHNQFEKNKRFQQLGESFIAATSVYNAINNDLSSLMLQHSRLLLLLARVINHRKINHLPIHFVDFTGKLINQKDLLKEEDMLLCQSTLQKNLEIMRLFHITDYKLKYLKDEEMSAIHAEFLQRQLEFIESRIIALVDEIKLVMQKKAKTST